MVAEGLPNQIDVSLQLCRHAASEISAQFIDVFDVFIRKLQVIPPVFIELEQLGRRTLLGAQRIPLLRTPAGTSPHTTSLIILPQLETKTPRRAGAVSPACSQNTPRHTYARPDSQRPVVGREVIEGRRVPPQQHCGLLLLRFL